MKNIPESDGLLIGFDFTHGRDVGVLIVGRREGKSTKIVNAFQGEEALDIYKKLVTKKENTHD